MSNSVQSVLRDHRADLKRLRWLLAGVLLALLVPTAILASRAYDQLGYESLHRYRLASENIAQTIEAGLQRLLVAEATHTAEQFSFYLVPPRGAVPGVISPLAQLDSEHLLPGAVGHFVISAAGELQTPLLPDDAALAGLVQREVLTAADVAQRQRQQQLMATLLGTLAFVDGTLAEDQSTEDRSDPPPKDEFTPQPRPAPLATEATELELDDRAELQQRPAAAAADSSSAFSGGSSSGALLGKNANQQVFERLTSNGARKDQVRKDAMRKRAELASDESVASSLSLQQGYIKRAQQEQATKPKLAGPQFEAAPEVGPRDFEWFVRTDGAMQYLPLGTDHLLLYRRSWQTGTAVVLGLILEQQALFTALVDTPFSNAQGNDNLRLTLTDGNRPVRSVMASAAATGYVSSRYVPEPKLGGELLFRSRLPAPFGDLQLVFSADQVGLPPGGAWIVGSSALLIVLLLAGFALIYRLGVRELERRATQQNFVSAVSHELKTPLTAIRMYGEMLKGGWVSEEKKPGYYEFIFSESERLSRLISNVLRLSQISRDRLALSPQPHTAGELVDIARSKLQSLSEASSVPLEFDLPPTLADAQVNVDMDAFVQVLINLVDNAIKFAAQAGDQRVVVAFQGLPSNLPSDRRELRLSVRDFGPGIPKAQLGRIFDLFYRGENEITRQTQGT
ncbi:MAG: sensor histidine kinase, partial [Pseudomonadales bacterium]